MSRHTGASTSYLPPSSIFHRNTSLARTFLLCRQTAQATIVDVEVAEAARAFQVMATVVVVVVVAVVVAVVVGAATRLLSTEPQPPEEYVTSIGPLEPAIAASIAHTSTRQGSRRLRPPHNPWIILPISSL